MIATALAVALLATSPAMLAGDPLMTEISALDAAVFGAYN